MQKNADIQFLHHSEIDRQKWDGCITSCPHGLIYARSFYLDNVCPRWCALTGDNYEWVLPLTHSKKWGISYLYQPPFTQQLGVFALARSKPPFAEILNWLKKHFNFWEINWNYSTDTKNITYPVQLTTATNFILDLSNNYESIATNYHKDLVKNIKRSQHFRLSYRTTYDFNKCIELFKKHYAVRLPHITGKDYKNFEKISEFAADNKMFIGREAVGDKGELMAVILLLSDGNRLYNIMNTTTEAGRETEANHFLIDNVIKEFSGKNLLFDFEGSDLPGVRSFYKNFGAINQPYYMLKYNALPKWVRLFKK
jgi:hypothetical protein